MHIAILALVAIFNSVDSTSSKMKVDFGINLPSMSFNLPSMGFPKMQITAVVNRKKARKPMKIELPAISLHAKSLEDPWSYGGGGEQYDGDQYGGGGYQSDGYDAGYASEANESYEEDEESNREEDEEYRNENNKSEENKQPNNGVANVQPTNGQNNGQTMENALSHRPEGNHVNNQNIHLHGSHNGQKNHLVQPYEVRGQTNGANNEIYRPQGNQINPQNLPFYRPEDKSRNSVPFYPSIEKNFQPGNNQPNEMLKIQHYHDQSIIKQNGPVTNHKAGINKQMSFLPSKLLYHNIIENNGEKQHINSFPRQTINDHGSQKVYANVNTKFRAHNMVAPQEDIIYGKIANPNTDRYLPSNSIVHKTIIPMTWESLDLPYFGYV